MWCAASRMLMLQVLYLAVRYAALEALQYLTAHVKTLPIGSRMRVILPPPNQVRTRVGHLVRFLHQNDPSTKTGSGQTQGKLQTKPVLLQFCGWPTAPPPQAQQLLFDHQVRKLHFLSAFNDLM